MHQQVFKRIAQINIIVPDIKRSSAMLDSKYLIGPWNFIYNNLKIKDLKLNKSIYCVFEQAVCLLDGVELSLIEPKNKEGIFYEFFITYGSGPYYVCFEVEDCKKTIQYLKQQGILITHIGSWQGREYYFVSKEGKIDFCYCFFESKI